MAGRTGPCTDRRRDRRTGSSCWSGCFWQLRIRGASCTSVCNRMPRRRDSISVTPPSPLLAAQRGLGVDREQDVCIPDRTTTKTRPATGRRFSCVPPSGSQRITSPLAPLFSFSLGGHDVLLSRLRRPKRIGFCRVPAGSGRRNQGRANASEAAVSSRVA